MKDVRKPGCAVSDVLCRHAAISHAISTRPKDSSTFNHEATDHRIINSWTHEVPADSTLTNLIGLLDEDEALHREAAEEAEKQSVSSSKIRVRIGKTDITEIAVPIKKGP